MEARADTDAGAGASRPTGEILASAAGKVVTLWSPLGEKIHAFAPAASTAVALAFDRPGTDLGVALNGEIAVHRIEKTRYETRRYKWPAACLTVNFSGNGRYLASGMADGISAFLESLDGQGFADVQLLSERGVQGDAAIGVTFTSLFALGVALISLYGSQVDLDLDCVLYGEIAYAPFDTLTVAGRNVGPLALWTNGLILLVNLAVVGFLFKQLKLCAFDPEMAAAVGIPVAALHYLLMGLVAATTVGAFESVGAILVVAMLIVPAATAYLLTHRLERMIQVAVLAGVISAIGGYQMARALDCSIAGAMATISGVLFAVAFMFSPSQGFVTRLWNRQRMRLRVGEEDILLWAGRRQEFALPGTFTLRELERGDLKKDGRLSSAAKRLRRAGDLFVDGGKLALTEKGMHRALALLRRHRLFTKAISASLAIRPITCTNPRIASSISLPRRSPMTSRKRRTIQPRILRGRRFRPRNPGCEEFLTRGHHSRSRSRNEPDSGRCSRRASGGIFLSILDGARARRFRVRHVQPGSIDLSHPRRPGTFGAGRWREAFRRRAPRIRARARGRGARSPRVFSWRPHPRSRSPFFSGSWPRPWPTRFAILICNRRCACWRSPFPRRSVSRSSPGSAKRSGAFAPRSWPGRFSIPRFALS